MKLYLLDDDIIELALWAELIRTSHPEIEYQLFTDCCLLQAAVIKNPPDACVLDLIMPFHPGTEICKWITEHHTSVKVFFNTALDGDEYHVLADSCNATYMCKTTMEFPERLEVVVNGCKS